MSLTNTIFLFLNIHLDPRCSDQCELFVKQGGVDRLDGFLGENSPQRHRDLASLILKNVLLESYSIDPDGMYLDMDISIDGWRTLFQFFYI